MIIIRHMIYASSAKSNILNQIIKRSQGLILSFELVSFFHILIGNNHDADKQANHACQLREERSIVNEVAARLASHKCVDEIQILDFGISLSLARNLTKLISRDFYFRFLRVANRPLPPPFSPPPFLPLLSPSLCFPSSLFIPPIPSLCHSPFFFPIAPLSHSFPPPLLTVIIPTLPHLIPLPLGPFRITSCEPWPVMEPRGRCILFLHLLRLYDRRPGTTLVHGRDLYVCYQFPHLGSWCRGRHTTLGDCRIMGISEQFNYGAQDDPDHSWVEI